MWVGTSTSVFNLGATRQTGLAWAERERAGVWAGHDQVRTGDAWVGYVRFKVSLSGGNKKAYIFYSIFGIVTLCMCYK